MPRKMTSDDADVDTIDHDSDGVNLVVLRGELTSDPVHRELPSGEEVMNLEITTPTGLGRLSVPVVGTPMRTPLHEGSSVVVVGHVRRRFFRSGAGVQSRTEVVAETIVRTQSSVGVRKAINEAIEYLGVLD